MYIHCTEFLTYIYETSYTIMASSDSTSTPKPPQEAGDDLAVDSEVKGGDAASRQARNGGSREEATPNYNSIVLI